MQRSGKKRRKKDELLEGNVKLISRVKEGGEGERRKERKKSCKRGVHLNEITSWFALGTKIYRKLARINRIPSQMVSLMKETNKLINRKRGGRK